MKGYRRHAICPIPGCEAVVLVLDTRFVDGSVVRRRKCKNGHKFKTLEKLSDSTPVAKPGRRQNEVNWEDIKESLVEAGCPEHIVKTAIARVTRRGRA